MKPPPIFEQIFALILLLALIAVLGVLAFHEIPEKNMTLFASLASGVVGAGVGTYIGFVWGSAKRADGSAVQVPPSPPAPSAAEAPPQAPGGAQ